MVPLALSIGAAAAADLVLLDASDAPAEDRVVEELLLAGVEVRVEPAPDRFLDLALPAQLDAVRPQLAPGAAVGWLVASDALHLSVAYVEAERAVVRVVDAGPGEEARLALAARELLAAAVPPAPAPVAEVAPAPVAVGPHGSGSIAVLGVLPTAELAGGVRGGVEGALVAPVGPLRAGGRLGAQLGDGSVRGSLAALVHAGPVQVGLGADVAHLEWVTWVQPRAELGVAFELGRWFAAPRLRVAPLRDRVERDGTDVYDSGWVELAVAVGHRWPLRQIRPPS